MSDRLSMETYYGFVRTPVDAITLFEACRLGILPRVQRRLSEKERWSIRSGSIFVWDEREAGMRRWTDGKSWSASRVTGSFLTYREMEGKRADDEDSDESNNAVEDGESLDNSPVPDGYRYKPDGLMKQSFSITTSTNLRLHLISYFSRLHVNDLQVPSQDLQLKSVVIPKGLYPDSSTTLDQLVNLASTTNPNGSPFRPYDRFGHFEYPYSPQQAQVYLNNYPHQSPHAVTAQMHPSLVHPMQQAVPVQQVPHVPVPIPPGQQPIPFQTPPPLQHQQQQLQQQTSSQQHPQQHVHQFQSPLPIPQQQAPPPPPPPPLPTQSSISLPTPNGFKIQHAQSYPPMPLKVQDIPYEKVGWAEDARAIQVLDRRFLRSY